MNQHPFETYHIVYTDEEMGIQTIFNIEQVVEDVKSVCDSFFNYLMGQGEAEDVFHFEDIVPLMRYKVKPDFKGSQIKEEIYGLTNGLFSLSLLKIDYTTFQLKDFIARQQSL
jgi:hypothetical protein